MEPETRKICRKCLTGELEEKSYFENLHAYIENLDEDIKTEAALYQKRLSVCKDCERLADGMCRACGCFVELRAAVAKKGCPYFKW